MVSVPQVSDPTLNAAKVQGFFDYKFEEQILDFQPEKVDIKRVWHTGL